MKKLLFSLFLLCTVTCLSVQSAEQTQNVEDNKANFVFQKAPANVETSQTQVVKNNWFCIIVQNNGKLPFDKSGKGNN